jgi:hypothetical protein
MFTCSKLQIEHGRVQVYFQLWLVMYQIENLEMK